MTVIDIADEIHADLNSPSDLSVASISFWVRGHIGDLNNLLHTEYAISTDGLEIEPVLGEEEKSILKRLYNIHYYSIKVTENLGAAALDIVLEVSSDGGTVRTVNRNELAKSYTALRKMEEESLKGLMLGYKIRGSSPKQVTGDDIFSDNDSIFRSDNTRI